MQSLEFKTPIKIKIVPIFYLGCHFHIILCRKHHLKFHLCQVYGGKVLVYPGCLRPFLRLLHMASHPLCRVCFKTGYISFFLKPFWDVFLMILDRFVVLRVILYSHPNKVFSVINGLIFQVLRKDCDFEIVLAWNCAHSKFWWYHSKTSLKGLAFLAVSSHLRTMLTDPGMKTRKQSTLSFFSKCCHLILFASQELYPKEMQPRRTFKEWGLRRGRWIFWKYSFPVLKYINF